VSKVISNASGLPLSMTDPNGVVTTFAYDPRNRLLSRTIHANDGNAATGFGYDATGNLTKMTLPDGSQLLYTYDAAHRVIAVKNNVGESINYTLDANDDITQQQISGSTIAKTQTAVFDSLGRMLKQIGAYNETTAFAYDGNGNTLSTTDALNNATAQGFDALNRLVGSLDPLSNTTLNTFDAQDNLTGVTDPRSLVTSYAYDGFGEVIAQISPDTGMTTYTLDAMGDRISEKDARGIVMNRTFDKLNRVLTETYPSDRNENVIYTYDHGSFGIGHLTSISDESGSTQFTYNARGDILDDTRTIGGRGYNTSYTYDLADHITSITYPDRTTVNYTRDAFGRISAMDLRGRPLVSGVTYEPFGPVNGFTFGNGIKAQYTYDMDYRLTNILATGHNTIQNLTMAYDPVNNIASITDNNVSTDKDRDHDKDKDDRNNAPGFSQSFTYDADYRLLTANGPYDPETFTYDADGNRLTETDTVAGTPHTKTYSYAAMSNQLASIADESTHAFTYTVNGDLAAQTGGEDQTFTYNARNRNSAIETRGQDHDHDHSDDHNHDHGQDRDDDHGTGGANYLYNALGERVSKDPTGRDHEFNHGGTHFIYDQQGHLIAEDGKEYLYMDGLPIAMIEGNDLHYIHTDHLGTPQKMTDADQRVIWSRVSDPFGETFKTSGPETLNLRFTGQYHDNESGLDYNGFRSYNPRMGRYTQSDPIGLDGGINTYGYAGQSPVNAVDPSGRETITLSGVCSLNPEACTAIVTRLTVACAVNPACVGIVVGGIATGYLVYKMCHAALPQTPISTPISTPTPQQHPPCDPPSETQCYEEHTGHSHNGSDPHYHKWQINQNPQTGVCYWNDIGGPKGGTSSPPGGMKDCHSYPSWLAWKGLTPF